MTCVSTFQILPERIQSYFGDRIRDQHELDTWDYDLRNQTLLHRDAAGYYEFAHKSLAEYFTALKISSQAGLLSPMFKSGYLESDGSIAGFPYGDQYFNSSLLPLSFPNIEVAKFFLNISQDTLSRILPSTRSSRVDAQTFRKVKKDLIEVFNLSKRIPARKLPFKALIAFANILEADDFSIGYVFGNEFMLIANSNKFQKLHSSSLRGNNKLTGIGMFLQERNPILTNETRVSRRYCLNQFIEKSTIYFVRNCFSFYI